MYNCLKLENLNANVMTIISQVLIDKNDPAFENPTKPVGPFYTEKQAKRLQRERKYVIKAVNLNNKKPYRRVVPCPDPLMIVEGEQIKRLVDEGMVVIACGGGGIPVTQDGQGRLHGVEAVIDKDMSAEKLAEAVSADILIILTDVSNVYLNFATDNKKALDVIKISDAKRYIYEGHFLQGSMRQKVEACIRFLEFGGEKAIIAHLFDALVALEGRAGTHFIR
jgi:carbamate kinase